MLQNPSHPLHLVIGLTLWCFYFVVVYGGMSVACAVAAPNAEAGPWTWVNGVVLLVTVVFTLPLLLIAWKLWVQRHDSEPKRRFIVRLSAALYVIAGLATLAVGLPAMLYPPCL